MSGYQTVCRLYSRFFENALARAPNVPPRRINEIVLEKRGITADTALRLIRYFGTKAELRTGLQADYDFRLARYKKERQIERDVEPLARLSVLSSPIFSPFEKRPV